MNEFEREFKYCDNRDDINSDVLVEDKDYYDNTVSS